MLVVGDTQEHSPLNVSFNVFVLAVTDAPFDCFLVLFEDFVPFCLLFYEGLRGRIDRCWNDGEVGRHQSFESASAIAIDVDILGSIFTIFTGTSFQDWRKYVPVSRMRIETMS